MCGWIGTLMLAVCGLPLAIACIKNGHARDLDVGFLYLWTLGEIFTLFAIINDAPLIYLLVNYGSNLVFISVIWFYKLYPKE